ncbi:divergent polysaccharide deacetylase family protein [Parathalassolituus penaei]|uniref:Divergent polysaccharide deacetylase family protein n=1 Tax=Parathalassolituus penaei TaxID=2997323 RepID=A0A9X3EBT9_9GAMM|nr:divergent polysaccharide deacetylase family protein [Parathalassolituus penaei]MCY0964305.1 divergent polysaccharide deacetylase family protein [Parathalassolituus penaei]
MSRLLSLMTLCSLLLTSQAQAGKLILILDDIGNNHALGERAVRLPGQVNLAFLPHTPWAAPLAREAYRRGHTIMLHAPMANTNEYKLGPGALTETMNRQQIESTLLDDIRAIPYVQGVNNHMGSLLTQNANAMNWVMGVLSQEGLFFVDSRTTSNSVALAEARKAGLPSTARDVFLDNDRSHAALHARFEEALKLAAQHGQAVLIGHPYPETLDYLESVLPALNQRGFWLAGLSHVLPDQPPKPHAQMVATAAGNPGKPMPPLASDLPAYQKSGRAPGATAQPLIINGKPMPPLASDLSNRAQDNSRPANGQSQVPRPVKDYGIPVTNLPMSTKAFAATSVSQHPQQKHYSDYPMQALPVGAEIIRDPRKEVACPAGNEITPPANFHQLLILSQGFQAHEAQQGRP